LRDLFYHKARRGRGPAVVRKALPAEVALIGDARQPGQAGQAIRRAYAAALLGDPGAIETAD
jgi:hypothetical protein